MKPYQPKATINAELPDDPDSYTYTKVFWLENLDTLRPLCDAVTINKGSLSIVGVKVVKCNNYCCNFRSGVFFFNR